MYIDGPFFPNMELNLKQRKEELRNQVFEKMNERSKNSNIEHIKYIKKEELGEENEIRIS